MGMYLPQFNTSVVMRNTYTDALGGHMPAEMGNQLEPIKSAGINSLVNNILVLFVVGLMFTATATPVHLVN